MLEKKNNLKAWIYLAPILLIMGVFTFYPLFNTILLAFKITEAVEHPLYGEVFVDRGFGFNNFLYIFNDSDFKTAISNTFVIVFISVPISVALSLLMAVALNSIKRLQKFYQTVFFIPYITNAIAIGMVFSVMFSNNTGLINAILDTIGLNPIDWINESSSAISRMFVLQLYIVWSSLPFKILIFMSALQSVDKQYYQAAQLDNASKGTVLRRITIPLISPMIAYITITSFIGSFKEYSSVIGIWGDSAGPKGEGAGSMGTIVWYIYKYIGGSKANSSSIAAAAALVLLGIILCITAVNMYVSKKKVHF